MHIVFFGSSKYSVFDERALHDACGLSLVVTKQTPSNPVKQFALDNNIPCITPEKITPEVLEQIASYHPDFLVVADFGLILPTALLQLPKKAAINVHHSLLPKYRGPAPVPFAILHGEKVVGVTIIMMTQKVDAGDMLAQEKYTLLPTDTTDSVLTKLNQLGGELAVKVIKDFVNYFAKRIPQDESQATFTHYMKRDDGYIHVNGKWSIVNSQLLQRMIRAYYPWPGVWAFMKVKNKEIRVKFLPGEKVQVEGKKPVSYKDFVNGYPEAKDVLEKIGLL